MAHRGKKVQMEIVAVLAPISLLTHNHLFWIAGLLLALIDLPDFLIADGFNCASRWRNCLARPGRSNRRRWPSHRGA